MPAKLRSKDLKKQRYFYSGEKKRHTIKSQVVVKKISKIVICTNFSNGKRHDFRLFKESGVRFLTNTEVITDTGYQELNKVRANSLLPKKKNKKHPLTSEDKGENKKLSNQRVINENVIGMLKRFKIIADKYRNRRKRFGLRFNLIAGIYNYELA
ncbi:hypothetical protein MIDIC_330010 [Alphaproteobacteria bacterium]